jgi:hypothetical protein
MSASERMAGWRVPCGYAMDVKCFHPLRMKSPFYIILEKHFWERPWWNFGDVHVQSDDANHSLYFFEQVHNFNFFDDFWVDVFFLEGKEGGTHERGKL